MKLSAVILTRNEEKNIGRCLDGLKWCDEIIVIDDFSADKTTKIARSRGAKIFKRKLNNNFAAQRNFGLEKAENDWVLFVDADEVASPTLAANIVRRIKENKYNGFLISRKEVFAGKLLHCADKPIWDWSLGSIKLIRLGKKRAGRWQGKVHERWEIKGAVGKTKGYLLHYSFPNLTTALTKINCYTAIAAKNLYQQGKKTSSIQIILYPLGKFIKNFFWHQGFRDGTTGFIHCLLMSLHSFLVRGKLWQARIKEDK